VAGALRSLSSEDIDDVSIHVLSTSSDRPPGATTCSRCRSILDFTRDLGINTLGELLCQSAKNDEDSYQEYRQKKLAKMAGGVPDDHFSQYLREQAELEEKKRLEKEEKERQEQAKKEQSLQAPDPSAAPASTDADQEDDTGDKGEKGEPLLCDTCKGALDF
jgi:hypothetical protein